MPLFAYATVGDPGPMPFDLNLAGLQNGVLLYLGLSRPGVHGDLDCWLRAPLRRWASVFQDQVKLLHR